MERRVINPWTWQDQLGFVQANELKGAQRVLLCSGQTSVDDDGNPVNPSDMAGQVNKALDNLECRTSAIMGHIWEVENPRV